jgi:hypothetical protein
LSTHPNPLPTVGEIARRLGQPVHRVEYAVRSRRLRAAGRAGGCRVFSEEQVALIASALAEMDRRKGGAP